MYKILVDDTGNLQEEESKSELEHGVHKNVFNSEYFESIPLLQWNQLNPLGKIYTP
jgi:hypothetical protein